MSGAADDFDALFDEISAQRAAMTSAPVVPADKPGAAETSEAEPPATREDQSGKPMFERLGGIVRMLHDSLRELGYDRSLSNVATQINDAQDRLAYVATLTEQAANKVLNAIDIGMPAQDALSKKSKDMESRWALLFGGKLSIDEFKTLAADSKLFAAAVTENTEAEKARLLEIMMAQDFQDITGQLIKKIVAITNTAEHELAQLLRDNAPPELKAVIEAAEHQPTVTLHGPSAPAEAMAQDGVDDLLDSLGF